MPDQRSSLDRPLVEAAGLLRGAGESRADWTIVGRPIACTAIRSVGTGSCTAQDGSSGRATCSLSGGRE